MDRLRQTWWCYTKRKIDDLGNALYALIRDKNTSNKQLLTYNEFLIDSYSSKNMNHST